MIKKAAIYFVSVLLVLLMLPAVIVKSCRGPNQAPDSDEEEMIKINVYLHKEDVVKEMCLEEYLLGVVAGEMPASFDIEALRAQAVIARTYAYSRMRDFGGSGYSGHPDADICDDFKHSQHYITEEEAKSNWNKRQRNSNWNKIVEAVYSTQGEIITYDDKAIDALYHSTCGGGTENSEDIFTNKVAYLRGVECTYCADSSKLKQKVTYSKEEFIKILEEEGLGKVVSEGEIDMEVVSQTSSGRIIQYRIGDKVLRGSEVRSLFNLNSARFTYKYEESNIIFNVIGYGHGVGMCQYGSNGLAKEGHDYKEIINFYYTDVEIINIKK